MAGEGEESHKRIIEGSPRRLATKSQFLAKKWITVKPIEIWHTNLKFFFKDDITYKQKRKIQKPRNRINKFKTVTGARLNYNNFRHLQLCKPLIPCHRKGK
jgi:hypothetical protein